MRSFASAYADTIERLEQLSDLTLSRVTLMDLQLRSGIAIEPRIRFGTQNDDLLAWSALGRLC